jgi:hypothetical protein
VVLQDRHVQYVAIDAVPSKDIPDIDRAHAGSMAGPGRIADQTTAPAAALEGEAQAALLSRNTAEPVKSAAAAIFNSLVSLDQGGSRPFRRGWTASVRLTDC